MADNESSPQEKLFFLEENEAYNFYIGKNAGGKIKSAIKDAKKAIRIISPFINESTIEILRGKYINDSFHDISMITCLKESDLRWENKIRALDRLISRKKEGEEYISRPVLNTVFFKGDYIHEKLFLIDDKTYTGSVNFTDKGMEANHETCLLLKNPEVTKKLYAYFDKFVASYYSRWDINELGTKVFFKKRDIEKKKADAKPRK
ncbi:MAG: phospholipase D family protein [Spirochaetaceae bacterium]|jgi:phosphatidylserine/phosphatidylglycerophosphate/cardiolipin synthase-like enzyme|nr:phospholipase D family protein [Spirochaetaceae bacterium]